MRRGFTLIEVVAVVAILALLAGATAWALAGEVGRGQWDAAVAQLAHADRAARTAAQRYGRPTSLWLDLDDRRVWRSTDDGAGQPVAAGGARLPAAHRIDRVRLAGSADAEGGAKPGPATLSAERRGGVVEVPMSTAGRSATYALRLVPDKRAQDGAVWLVFAGLTGEMVMLDDDAEVDNLFAALAAGGPDAD